MKLEPVSKFRKKNMAMSKKLTMTSSQKIVPQLLFFHFWPVWSNPEAKFCPDGLSKLTFSLVTTFYLTKVENRTKTSPKQL